MVVGLSAMGRALVLLLLMSGCASVGLNSNHGDCWEGLICERGPTIEPSATTQLLNLPYPNQKTVVAVYDFPDLTGQRKSNSTYALFSSAVTMDPASLLIRAVKHAGEGKFFRIVERAGLDHLTKERQLIRSTRNSLEDKTAVLPLLFAGLLLEGGVIGYDANLRSGGIGARYLGIGAQKQYREDTVTISLRAVSVSSGEVLIEILQKLWFPQHKEETYLGSSYKEPN